MATLRATATLRIRTAPAVRSGVLDNGNPWQVREVETIDVDDNKNTLRIREGVNVEAGKTYACEVDTECDKRNKAAVMIVSAVPAPVPARV